MLELESHKNESYEQLKNNLILHFLFFVDIFTFCAIFVAFIFFLFEYQLSFITFMHINIIKINFMC